MKVLLLGAGGAAARGVANSLKRAGHFIVHADANREALWFCNDAAREVVTCDDGSLFAAIRRHKPDVIHSQPDEEVLRVSKLRNEIRDLGCSVFLPRRNVITLCQDKYATYKQLHRCKVPVPLSCNPRDLHELPGGKVHVRPKTGAGGKGSFSGSKRDARVWLDHVSGWHTFMAAEYLPGPTVTWQAVYANGELYCSQTRARRAWTHGDRGSALTSETVTDDRAVEVAKAAMFAIDLYPHGIYGVDMTLDIFGMPRVTEINIGRFFTTIEFFTRLGLNMPDMAVRLARGEDVERVGENPLPDGRRWYRAMDAPPVLV